MAVLDDFKAFLSNIYKEEDPVGPQGFKFSEYEKLSPELKKKISGKDKDFWQHMLREKLRAEESWVHPGSGNVKYGQVAQGARKRLDDYYFKYDEDGNIKNILEGNGNNMANAHSNIDSLSFILNHNYIFLYIQINSIN